VFRERFAEAVRRRVRSAYPAAVSLSGGLDSSSIFCQAEALRQRGAVASPGCAASPTWAPRARTLTSAAISSTSSAHTASRSIGFRFEPLLGLVKGMHEQVRAIEAPFVDYMWGVTRELHGRAASGGGRTFLSGQWGDQMMFSSAYLVDLFGRLSWWRAWQHVRE